MLASDGREASVVYEYRAVFLAAGGNGAASRLHHYTFKHRLTADLTKP
jgi:hypothetical protein